MRNIAEQFVRNIQTHFIFHDIFRQSCHLWENVDKYCKARQGHSWQYNTVEKRVDLNAE